ncbi:MAG TPA: helix-turn-helix transcriptional regulator [Steroidobacteraceae bacterium]|jgi:transcriptional regulator with XRE-family HTH domain
MLRLKQFLLDSKMKQTQLAELMGVSQPTVWEWLNGDSAPSAKSLIKLSQITGISIDDLLKKEVA